MDTAKRIAQRNKDKQRAERKFLKELNRKMGGIDFKKHPLTQEEEYNCVKKLGYLNLQKIAFDRRRIVIRRK